MQQPSLDLKSVIIVNGGVCLLYLMSILFAMPLAWILGLLLGAEATLVWMVFRILNDPWSTDKTFDEYFYQDREDIHRSGPE